MPSIEQNRDMWKSYRWPEEGEEWSATWGGARAQWWGTIFPRIVAYLPADTVLEIAPGRGRWTQFLVHLCRKFVAVDLDPSCIEHCKRRFGRSSHASFHANDGKSLPGVGDGEIDFAFSFDSLVHVERDSLNAYIDALSKVLSADGVAFLHHANLAALSLPKAPTSDPVPTHWRAATVSARSVAEACQAAGLVCTTQEIVDWGGCDELDTLSTITRPTSRWFRRSDVFINRDFMCEARLIAQRAERYGGAELDPTAPLALIGQAYRRPRWAWWRHKTRD